jgi:hypothetical protein
VSFYGEHEQVVAKVRVTRCVVTAEHAPTTDYGYQSRKDEKQPHENKVRQYGWYRLDGSFAYNCLGLIA